MAKNQIFKIDLKNKTFIFSHKHYQELFVEGSEANAAFHAAMNLGCYDGFVPVEDTKEPVNKNRETQKWTEDGVITFIKANCPDYLPRWEAMKKARTAANKPFMFMIRKNLFLYENADARKFCRVKDTEEEPYKMTENAEILKTVVDRLQQIEDKPAAPVKK